MLKEDATRQIINCPICESLHTVYYREVTIVYGRESVSDITYRCDACRKDFSVNELFLPIHNKIVERGKIFAKTFGA